MNPIVSAAGPLLLDASGNLTVATASGADAGVLSAADWQLFDSKLDSITASEGSAIDLGGTAKAPIVSVHFGPGGAVRDSDGRLSDARTPTAGSSLYLQNSPATPQAANISISGGATIAGAASIGGDLSFSGALHGDGSQLSGVPSLSAANVQFAGTVNAAGNLQSSGSLSGASASVSGAVGAGSVVSSGAVSGGSLTTTGAVTAASLSVSGTSALIGNVGIGTLAPQATLDVEGDARVDGAIFGGSGAGVSNSNRIFATPWQNVSSLPCGSNPTGYIKLVTPIQESEGNMFSVKIAAYGYSMNFNGELRCGGYAYTVGGLINQGCSGWGINIPFDIVAENRGGPQRVVVIRLGSPGSAWYYQHFTFEYLGWQPKKPGQFQWVCGETS